ncbi:PAN/Apple domain [Dillenia turbinata]|uniref:Receptor-like serine/threonine-protein kinase n=1 Tax=Dillenia turbinata TaxID=194707 RepID=A0AAN8Z1M9_9MAGN
MWYKKISVGKIVWVANGEKPVPVSNFSASLSIGDDGNLKIVDGKQRIIWSTDVDIGINKTVALLLDNGNFVLKENESGDFLWQSFHFPSNTLIAGMVLSVNSKTGERKYMTSWRSEDDPSKGEFTNGLVPQMPPQCFVWKGSKPYWRSGAWNGMTSIGIQGSRPSYFEKYTLNYNNQDGEYSISFDTYDSMIVLIALESNGSLRRLTWDETAKEWSSSFESINTGCDVYGTCGAFGFCDARKSPVCSCLKGFEPRFKDEWSTGNWSGGCDRRTELGYAGNFSGGSSLENKKKDVFSKVRGVKLPDFSLDMDFDDAKECEEWCLNNCSCLAYAYVDVLRCMVWTSDLIDTQKFLVPGGQDLYLRLAHSELDDKQKTSIIVSVSVVSGFIILGGLTYGFFRQQKAKQGLRKVSRRAMDLDGTISKRRSRVNQGNEPELPQFMFNSILVATENFSVTNKLGEGGFGTVYKGKLIDKQEVAVKRLSKMSRQGVQEFKNEIILITKLQHRNLVKLLGYCIEGNEKLLIYEFMPNKSLDTHLFGQLRNPLPSTAMHVTYLLRNCIVLKLSSEQSFKKMVIWISFGYMSPEYAMGGIFSEKTDVFSFGVLLLEIVSGKKNTNPCFHEQSLNLVGYAWQLWNEGRVLELTDPELVLSFCPSEVLRCIHVGLLCVQNNSKDRPPMSEVILMLSSGTDRREPKEPAFVAFGKPLEHDPQALTGGLSWSAVEAR